MKRTGDFWRQPIPLPRLARHRLAIAATFAALLLLLFPGPALEGRVFFYRDISVVWLAQVEAFVRSVAGGAWPVWDPALAFGHPLLANPNVQALYPFTWLNLVLRPGTVYTLYVFAHLMLGGSGTALLARRLGLSRGASLLAGCVWIASGPLLSLVNVWHHLAGAAWLPWVLALADRALHSGQLTHVPAWGIAVALQVFAGSPDFCMFTGLLCLAQLAAVADWRRPWGPSTRRRLLLTVAAYAMGAGLAAAQLLPSLALARTSMRGDLPRNARVGWSLPPAALAGMFVPLPFEDLSRLASAEARDRLFELWSPFLRSNYLGLTTVPLFAAAMMSRRRRGRTALVLLVIAGALFALGGHTVVYDLATAVIAPLRMLRYPSKLVVVVAFAWALLVGMGFDAWCEAGPRSGPRVSALAVLGLVLVATLAGLAAAAGYLAGPFARPIGPGAPTWAALFASGAMLLAPAVGAASLLLASFAVGLLRNPSAPERHAIGALIVLDLAVANHRINPAADPLFLAHRPEMLKEMHRDPPPRIFVWDYMLRVSGRGHPAQEMVDVLLDVPGAPPDLAQAAAIQEYLYPPSGGRWGLRGSFDRDLLGFYPEELDQLNVLLRTVEDTPGYLRLLQLGGVDFVVALHTEGQHLLVHRSTFRGFYRKPIQLFEVPGRLPRAYVVGRARQAVGTQALLALLDPSFDPAKEVVLSEAADAGIQGEFAGAAAIVSTHPDRVTVDAEASRDGYLVLLDGYAPGWKASVDGREARVLRANHVFRAVRVPPGRHRIDFAYRPASIRWGVALSFLSLLVAAGVGVRTRTRRTGDRGSDLG